MNNLIDQIDAYLDGTMNAEDSASFEAKMNSDASLLDQVNTQRNLRAGIERIGMKAATAQTFKKITLKNKLYKWGIATLAVAAIATSAYLATTTSTTTDGAEITYELPATNEEGGTNWADADRNLPTQLFEINPAKDTVIETMGGIVFAIPAGAFLNAGDQFTLEIREALTPMDIMKAGLSTTSNGELLETGGMFYLNARNGEASLKINPDKPVYANVPTNEIRPGMQLFEGERTADGGINWVNPKPMEKQLIPVDIFSLNFYPDGFLEKVAELGFDANDSTVTDSIYYSYAGRQQQFLQPMEEIYSEMDTLRSQVFYSNEISVDGEKLFNANCASCHTTTEQRSTGSGLKGVLSRIPGGDWKYDYVHNPSAVVKSGEPYANKLYQQNKSVMTAFPRLTNAEIDAILAYADHGGKPYGMEIDPARIAAIHTAEFQNTLIATKEFEERLQVIFSLGNPGMLDLYVNNLDKKLYQIDSMAMNMAGGEQFRGFYARHDGGVAVSQSHMKELQEYYQKKQEAARTASERTYNGRTDEQRKQDSIYFAGQYEREIDKIDQYGENLRAEYEINIREAYEQLGISRTAKVEYQGGGGGESYGLQVETTGWKNVDAFVWESTVNRTTLDYTDPTTGRTAVIRYEELQINIPDAATYNQVMVYLVTDSLPCFMRVNEVNGAYSEKLNELLDYSLVVMAEKDGTWFSSTTPTVTPGSVNVTLIATDESSLRNSLNGLFAGKVGSEFDTEVNYMKETRAYEVRQEKAKQQAEIDRQIMEVIFPFYGAFQDVKPANSSDTATKVVVSDVGCDEARKQLAAAKTNAGILKAAAYKTADDAKTAAYAEADRVEKSYKNPLEKAAKKAAADSMRKTADDANARSKANADAAEKNAISATQAKVDATCGNP